MTRWSEPPRNKYCAELRKIIDERQRQLNVAHNGSTFCAWWGLRPPPLKNNGTCPKYRAPDIFHDRVVGSLDDVLEVFIKGGILPPRDEFSVEPIPLEWAAAGMAAAEAANAKRRQKKTIKADPARGGLFEPQDIAITGKQRAGYQT